MESGDGRGESRYPGWGATQGHFGTHYSNAALRQALSSQRGSDRYRLGHLRFDFNWQGFKDRRPAHQVVKEVNEADSSAHVQPRTRRGCHQRCSRELPALLKCGGGDGWDRSRMRGAPMGATRRRDRSRDDPAVDVAPRCAGREVPTGLDSLATRPRSAALMAGRHRRCRPKSVPARAAVWSACGLLSELERVSGWPAPGQPPPMPPGSRIGNRLRANNAAVPAVVGDTSAASWVASRRYADCRGRKPTVPYAVRANFAQDLGIRANDLVKQLLWRSKVAVAASDLAQAWCNHRYRRRSTRSAPRSP